MSEEKEGLLAVMGARYNIIPSKLLPALNKVWGVKDEPTLISLCIVAEQYGLNPFTNEIYAFENKRNGKIVPVVGIDGWSRIINEHPQFDGMEVTVTPDGEEATCTIWRKDRNHPITVTEYKRECYRQTDPWKTHPLRMLRHKAIIQCARVAFGFSGIYEQDEAETFSRPVKEMKKQALIDSVKARLKEQAAEEADEIITAEYVEQEPEEQEGQK